MRIRHTMPEWAKRPLDRCVPLMRPALVLAGMGIVVTVLTTWLSVAGLPGWQLVGVLAFLRCFIGFAAFVTITFGGLLIVVAAETQVAGEGAVRVARAVRRTRIGHRGPAELLSGQAPEGTGLEPEAGSAPKGSGTEPMASTAAAPKRGATDALASPGVAVAT